MPYALVLGGTGSIGRAIARRLLAAGWRVEVTGRDPAHLPTALAAAGAGFVIADRDDPARPIAARAAGADLLVDCICYTAAHARRLVDLAGEARATVMMSSKAVYVDEAGRHSNSDAAPHYAGPVREDQSTLAPSDEDYQTREGYGANKVAAEHVLLDSGLPITLLRPSRVHGVGAHRPREWAFVKRVLDGRDAVLLAHRGAGVVQPTAAANIAALVEVVAAQPGQRILNIADPDAPSGLEIARTIARQLGHDWREVLLDDDADPALGRHPWESPHPVVLDTSAAVALGYTPAGDYAATVAETVDWLVTAARGGADADLLPAADDPYFARFLDYAAEDRYLASLTSLTSQTP